MAKTEEIVKTGTQALSNISDFITTERPAGRDEGELGTEGIGRDDILMPRIGIAQKMSPEIDPTNQARYIDGLTFTDFFNTQTKKNLGKGPLHFVILRRDDPRWMEWIPREQGGGIKDRNVKKGDPRTKFGPNGEKPIAAKYYDFIVLLLTGFDPADPMASIVGLSLTSSGIAAAQKLNMLIGARGPKRICKGVYSLTSGHAVDKKSQGVYATYNFNNAGWLKPGSAMEQLADELFEAWKDKHVSIDVEGDEPDDPDSFEPAKFEGADL